MKLEEIMNKKYALMLLTLLFLYIIFLGLTIYKNPPVIFNPQGLIAIQERNLLVTAIILGLSIVVPTVLALYFIVWKYRAGNIKAKYSPETSSTFLKIVWWAIPSAAMFVLAILAWNGAHKLDPYKPIDSKIPPITINVVALRWKWLFIYPKENIATVNFIQFPVNTPVDFELTSDASMNSFWIPSLAGQIYAMSAMQTKLHVLVDKQGDYQGGAAEINGEGLSEMKFIARASSRNDYDKWIESIKVSAKPLDSKEYDKLYKPSTGNPPAFYSPVDKTLYNQIISKFMSPTKAPMQMGK